MVIAAMLVIAIFVDLGGFGGGFIGGSSFFAANFLCVGYFAGAGIAARFVAYPKTIPIWGALIATGAAYFGWFLVLAVLHAKPQLSIFFVLSLALCYKVQRMAQTGKTESVLGGSGELSDVANTQPKSSQHVHPSGKTSSRVSIVAAVGLLAVALAFSFPRFTETQTHKGTGHVISILDRGRSFIFSPPPPSQGSESVLLCTVAINWPRLGSEFGFIAIWTVIAGLLTGYLGKR